MPTEERKAATIDVPEVVTVGDHKRDAKRQPPNPEATPKPANDDRKTRIVTSRPQHGQFGDVSDMTPEEHRQRGDAAAALWREPTRRVTESRSPSQRGISAYMGTIRYRQPPRH